MGLSSTKTKTKTQETATTAPNTPAYAQAPVEAYYGKVNNLMGADPSVFAPQTNLLQNQVFTQAQGLGQGNGGLFVAGSNANNIMGAVRNAPQVTANTASLPADFSAMTAQTPGPLGTANVANVAGPTAAQANVGQYGPLAMAGGDGSGYSTGGPMSYGGASALGGVKGYLDPQLETYVKAFGDDFDDKAAQQRAAYERAGAMNKGLGGSGYYVGQGQLDSDLTRDRALGSAGLRSDAYKTALAASSADADRANSAGIASMQSGNQFNTSLSDRMAQLGMFNAGSVNDRSKSLFDAINQTGMFNAGQANDLAGQVFGEQSANARQNAASANDNARLAYSTGADLSKFNADAGNTAQNLQYGTKADAAKFNADQVNSNNRANADRTMQGLGMALDANGQLVNIANSDAQNTRADLSLKSELGNSLYDIMRQQGLAPYTQTGVLGDLLNPAMLGQITGQTVNSSGTSTSKQGMNLLQSLIAAGSKVGSAFAGGG